MEVGVIILKYEEFITAHACMAMLATNEAALISLPILLVSFFVCI
jgi:hypothetical protein